MKWDSDAIYEFLHHYESQKDKHSFSLESIHSKSKIALIEQLSASGLIEIVKPERVYRPGEMVYGGLAQMLPKKTFYITSDGYNFIEEYRNNFWWKKGMRMLSGWADKAMTSILLPIVVALLTVLALNYFGLTGGGSPTP